MKVPQRLKAIVQSIDGAVWHLTTRIGVLQAHIDPTTTPRKIKISSKPGIRGVVHLIHGGNRYETAVWHFKPNKSQSNKVESLLRMLRE